MSGNNSKNKKSKLNRTKFNNDYIYEQKEKNNIKEKEINNGKKEEIINTDTKLKQIFSIKEHNDWVESVKIFPSGNIISVSYDRSINIFDGNNYNILQNITNAHNQNIIYLAIKDENNFATCSYDRCISIWTKNKNNFIKDKSIFNAHKAKINCLIYLLNNKIISCSTDRTIKIRELNNNKYQLITSIKFNYDNNNNDLLSLLLLEDKNILVNAGENGTFFWKITKEGIIIKFNHRFSNAICTCWNGLNRIDEDRIIVGCEEELNIISIKDKNIIKTIIIPFRCNGIISIKEKGIFLYGGWSKNIKIYRNDNYECLSTIENAHREYIVGFCQLKNGLILSFSGDCAMKIWSIE